MHGSEVSGRQGHKPPAGRRDDLQSLGYGTYSAKVGPKEPRAGKVIVDLHHYKHQPLDNDLATLLQIVVRRGKEIRRRSNLLESCTLKLPVELKPTIDRALKLAAEDADKEPVRSKLSGIVKKHYYGLAAGEQGWQSQDWPCMHPQCKKKKVIGSHVLQSAGPIAALAEPIPSDPKSSVVITPLWDAIKHNKVGRPVAQTEASKFPGFCHCHDSTLFKELENQGGEKTDKGRQLQAYRSFCREMRRLEASNNSVSTAVKRIKDEQRIIIKALFCSYIPATVLTEYPGIADMKLVLNVFKYADYEVQFHRQQQFLSQIAMLKPTFDDFITSNIVQPDIWIDHWTMPFVTSFAFSGVADLASSADLPIPLFMFVLPSQRTTEVVVFSHRSHAMKVEAFLASKKISTHPGLSLPADVLVFCEQFMFDATNHWFIRPSVWNSFCAPKKDQIELRTSDPTNNLWSSVSEIIFSLDRQNALSIRTEV